MKPYPLIAALLCGLLLQPAHAKVALVIGNEKYNSRTFEDLPQAVNDAHTVAKLLHDELGYEVIERQDLEIDAMRQALEDFHDKLKKSNDSGVFYYAGHGMQIDGNNYLIPVKRQILRNYEVKVQSNALLADEVLIAMEDAGSKFNIVILDACRDNLLTKGGKRGLTAMSKENFFILFATQQDKSSYDGMFVKHLQNWLTKPNLEINEMSRQVRNEMRIDPDLPELQIPAWFSNLSADFYLNPQPTQTAPAPTIATVVTPATAPQIPSPPPQPARLPFEPEMVAIKAKDQCFMMGSPDNEPERGEDERQHQVCLSQDYEMGKYEVTQAQWQAVMSANPSHFKGDNLPVENVSWLDIQDFIVKLNHLTGKTYGLPTEAQWEYAARANANPPTPFYTGRCITTDQANYGDNEDYNGCGAKTGVYLQKTKPVGSYPANPWGLHDMAGNVREWSCSAYMDTYDGSELACAKADDNRPRVLRGGSWFSFPWMLRSAYREREFSSYRNGGVGFRLSRM